MSVYENVKKLCNERKQSIFQLEIEADLGNGTIGRWKKAKPRIDTLMKVATALEVPIEVLLHGDGETE